MLGRLDDELSLAQENMNVVMRKITTLLGTSVVFVMLILLTFAVQL